MSSIPFLSVPQEILENIAFETACLDILGPPVHLISLFCTCRDIYRVLSHSSNLYARIFKAKFDITAARRRLGHDAYVNRNLASQLKKQCISLRRIRNGDIYATTVEDDLWTSYLMMLENDGKNVIQLNEYANLGDFVDRFVRTRLHEDVSSTGWPVESPSKALALWLMWMTSESVKLLNESSDRHNELISLILPYVVGSFRYNSFYWSDASMHQFDIPSTPSSLSLSTTSSHPTHSINTIHGPYPPPVSCTAKNLLHYGHETRLACPILSTAAALIHFSRNDKNPIQPYPGLPRDRAHALEMGLGYGRPTLADFWELNATPHTRLPYVGKWDWKDDVDCEIVQGNEVDYAAPSTAYDDDWERLMWNADADMGVPHPPPGPTYTFGSMNGLWVGKMYIPDDQDFFSLIPNPQLPEGFSEYYPQLAIRFVYMRLKEYHCITPAKPMISGDIRNAWCPGFKKQEADGIATFLDLNTKEVHCYEEYVKGQPNSHSIETCTTCQYFRDHPNDTDNEEEENEDEDAMSIDDYESQSEVEADVDMISEENVRVLEETLEEAGLGGRSFGASGYNACDDNYGDDDNGYDDDDDELFECNGFKDLIFTGETDERHGDAWGHYQFYGRVRTLDGLIAIVGLPRDPANGKYIFRGYLHGGQNFCGRWRHALHDVDQPPYEGTFTLSKCDEEAVATQLNAAAHGQWHTQDSQTVV